MRRLLLAGWLTLAMARAVVAAPTDRYALLVGINAYQNHLPQLRGCVQDVQDMKDVLVRKYGFDPTHVMTLTDLQATHRGIVQAFRRHLIAAARAHPDATVVFMYSGHGSEVVDGDAAKASGVHSTIVPVNSRDAAGKHFDIRDDELALLVGELCQYTSNVTLVFDSCHSGSVTRGAGPSGVREIERDLRLQPKAPAEPAVAAAAAGGRALLPFNQRYVAVSACQWYECAHERTDRPGGALVGGLVAALWRARPEATCREIMEQVATSVGARWVDQHPDVEGDLHRAFLGGAASREDPFIKLDRVEGRRITVAAGRVQGLQPGMLLAVYDPSARHLRGPEHRLAEATVTAVKPFTATAVLVGAAALPADAKVVAVTPLLGSRRLRVALPAGATALRAGVKASVLLAAAGATPPQGGAKASGLPAASGWDVRVARGRFGEVFPDARRVAPGARLPASDAGVLYLCGHDGHPLLGWFGMLHDPAASAKAVDALEKLARERNLTALSNATSSLSGALGLRVLRVQGTPGAHFGFHVDREEAVGDTTLQVPFQPGDYYRVELENRAASELYVTLFDLGPDGSIQILYPPSGVGERFPHGRKVKLPDVFQITAPPGCETLKAVATTRPTDFSYLVQGAAHRGAETAPKSAVESLMGRALGQNRDLQLVGGPAEDWTTTEVDFVIR